MEHLKQSIKRYLDKWVLCRACDKMINKYKHGVFMRQHN